MFPMERSRIYKILFEIFNHNNIKPTTNLCGITLKESSSHTSDIDFWCDENALIGYLRIVNPPENCVDGEYCLIHHSSLSQQDANIGIGPTGATRVYGEEIKNSFIYRTLVANKNKFGEYAKELTCAEQKLVFDKVVCAVSTFCEKLMNEHASTFDQLDMTVDRDDCKFFYVRSLNSPHMNFQFDVVSHIDTVSIPNNEVWVRFSVASGSLWTPITINPYKGQIVIHADVEQPVFTGVFNGKQLVNLATKIREATGFVVCCNEGASDKSQARSIYIRRMLEKSDELSMLKKSIVDINKAVDEVKDSMIGCEDVFEAVVSWLNDMISHDRITGINNITRNKKYQAYSVDVINTVGHGVNSYEVCEKLEVAYTPYMKTIKITLGKELIITIDYLGLGDNRTCVYILKYNPKEIDDVLNKYLIACLAERLHKVFKLDKLRAYSTVKCTQYTELKHCGPCFFNDDGMTAYAIDPNNVISNENINKNNKVSSIDDIVDLVKKNLTKIPESGRPMKTKEYLTEQILSQLKNDWHKNVYTSVYSSVWCTLVESRFKMVAYEFEKHLMEYVTLDNDDCFTVRFGLQKIDDNLPGIEIKFYSATQDIYVRMLDHKSSGSGTWSRPLIELKMGSESKVYFDTIKKTNCTYKSFLANVVSKIVLLEGLS